MFTFFMTRARAEIHRCRSRIGERDSDREGVFRAGGPAAESGICRYVMAATGRRDLRPAPVPRRAQVRSGLALAAEEAVRPDLTQLGDDRGLVTTVADVLLEPPERVQVGQRGLPVVALGRGEVDERHPRRRAGTSRSGTLRVRCA